MNMSANTKLHKIPFEKLDEIGARDDKLYQIKINRYKRAWKELLFNPITYIFLVIFITFGEYHGWVLITMVDIIWKYFITAFITIVAEHIIIKYYKN